MKIRLLDYAILCALAGWSSTTAAQVTPPSDDLVFDVGTRGEREPVTRGTNARSSSEALQPDRRATLAIESAGKADAVARWSVTLPQGGRLWAVEDPTLGPPRLTASAAGTIAFDGTKITTPVDFDTDANYADFIARAEILVFSALDESRRRPLARLPLSAARAGKVTWDGVLPEGAGLRVGDELVHLVRAYDADGRIDETWPKRMRLVAPQDTKTAAPAKTPDEPADVGPLRVQNIPLRGSRIRLLGRDIPRGTSLSIDGRAIPVDQRGEMLAEFLVPIGRRRFEIALAGGGAPVTKTIEVDVTGRYLFAMGIADITGASVQGGVDPASGDPLDDGWLYDGRLAFYMKGKAKGKYLFTAQADTTERRLGDLFDGMLEAQPDDIFRRLDPDRYYPVYGDDSTTWRDVDTMGRLYARLEWDRNQVLWGNYNTALAGTEFAQYSRSLYGMSVQLRSTGNTEAGDPKSMLRTFGSKAESAHGHDEFLGTGGSLYYLKRPDVLPGSDQVVLEVRDAATGRVQRRAALARGADYQIDEMQGRILLARPLSQITRELLPMLGRDQPLDGYAQFLVVDYEFVPAGFDDESATVGLRGKQWFGDHVALGATYVDEARAGADYKLEGGDFTIRADAGTWVRVEHSRSQSTGAPSHVSDDGGLSFIETNAGLGERSGDARAIEARADLRGLGLSTRDGAVSAWWRDVEAGFSGSRTDDGQAVEDRGVEMDVALGDDVRVHGRYSRGRRGTDELAQAQITAEWWATKSSSWAMELRRVREAYAAMQAATGEVAALRYKQRIGLGELYATVQETLDDDEGRYRRNDALTLGGRYAFTERTNAGLELTKGDRGNAAQLSAEYGISPDHTVYGRYARSTDATHDPFSGVPEGGWTAGQRWRVSNHVSLFNESQWLKQPGESGLSHAYGVDLVPADGWRVGVTAHTASLDKSTGPVEREAVSVGGGYDGVDGTWSSKLEWRKDSGSERRHQWVTTHSAMLALDDDWRIGGRANYADTTDELDANARATFAEGNIGVAWRPHDGTKWALLAKYSFEYDLSTLPQTESGASNYDQRTQVASIEAIHRASPTWEFAAKAAHRRGEVRRGRAAGEWLDSTATLYALQVRMALEQDWHALAEHRWKLVRDGGNQSGYLVALDRDIGRNLRVGVGYNFTRFSDDLTDFDEDEKGFFVNFTGAF